MSPVDLFEDFDDIAELAEGLDDPSAGARIMAVIELADSADPAAIPFLARAIADEDAGVRKQAAQALTDFDGPETAAALVREAVHPEANIIFGTVIDDALGDEIRITVIAAGFDGGAPPVRRSPGALGQVDGATSAGAHDDGLPTNSDSVHAPVPATVGGAHDDTMVMGDDDAGLDVPAFLKR